MVSAVGIRTRNELRYYKRRGKMPRLRIRSLPKSVKEWKTMVDLRINETLQTGAVRVPLLPFYRLVGTVSNCAYAVRLETAPTGGRKCLFIFRIHYKLIHNLINRTEETQIASR